MTAGILPARRGRRAPPLPNSVRDSAFRRTSDTAELPLTFELVANISVPRTRRASTSDTASISDEALDRRRSRTSPSPGQPHQPTGETGVLPTRVRGGDGRPSGVRSVPLPVSAGRVAPVPSLLTTAVRVRVPAKVNLHL